MGPCIEKQVLFKFKRAADLESKKRLIHKHMKLHISLFSEIESFSA